MYSRLISSILYNYAQRPDEKFCYFKLFLYKLFLQNVQLILPKNVQNIVALEKKIYNS